jgi:Mn-dependent DtxR family transcriptional regulator
VSLNKNEEVVLGLLFEASKSLQVFTLYRRSDIGLSAVLQAVRALKSKQFVSVDLDEFVKLTDAGLEFALGALEKVKKLQAKPWREVPDRFLSMPRQRREIDLYIPRIPLLAKSFLG